MQRRRLLLTIVLVGLLVPAAGAQPLADPHEGRGSFLLQQIPLALGWYGTATALVLTNDQSDAKTFASIYLLSASAFYFGPMALIWNRPISNAQTHLAVGFGYRGVAAGFALGDIFNVGVKWQTAPPPDTYRYATYNMRHRFGFMLPVSLGAQVGGYYLARDMSIGRAALGLTYADFGSLDGLLICGAVADALDGSREVKISHYYLGGLAAGAAAGWWRQRNWDCTEGQATFVRTAGVVGTFVPGVLTYVLTGIPLEDDGDYDRFTWLAPLTVAGNIASVWAAERIVKEAPLTVNEGWICLGCAVGGGLLGSGLGYLITDEARDWSARPIVGLGTAGAIGGLYLGLRLAPTWNNRSASIPARGRDALCRVNFDFGALAAGAATFAQNRTVYAPRLVTVEF
jgi:hypothetical protein